MPAYIWYATPVNSAGTATANSAQLSVWIGTLPHPAPPPSYDLYLVDPNGDDLIDAPEWRDFTGGGLGLNGGAPDRLFYGNPGGAGTLYTSFAITSGTTGLKNTLINNFTGVPGSLNPNPPCFVSGTRIKVPNGWAMVEELAAGDRVSLYDGGVARIRWAGKVHIPAARLSQNPKLRPIRIRANAFGPGLPRRDLLLSPQHRVLLRSYMADLLVGESEVLLAAVKLLGLRGVSVEDACHDVTYHHLALHRHQVLIAEDLPTESLYLGKSALNALPQAARDEIAALFPQLLDLQYQPKPARPIIEGPSATVIARSLPQDLAGVWL